MAPQSAPEPAPRATPMPPGPRHPRRSRLRSLRARVTAGALLVLVIALGGGSIAAVQILEGNLTDGVESTLEQDLESLAAQIDDDAEEVAVIDDDDRLVRLDPAGAAPPEDEDEPGPTGIAVNSPDAADLPVVEAGETQEVTVDREAYLAATTTTPAGTLTVARPLEPVQEASAAATALLAIAVPIALLLIGVVLWIVTGRALAPVERLRRQVDAIDAADTSQRVDAGADDELGALAATMNRMLERIQAAQVTQRRFVSDASHELRSPLATMRQHAELAEAHPEATSLESLSGVVRGEGARMQELVEGLLLLARLDEGQSRLAAEVDLDDLALAEVSRLRTMGVEADGRSIGPARALGDANLLARALRNLVDNAARHCESRVILRTRTSDDEVVIEVEDDGSGIPAGQREAVFDRFARLDEARARDEGGSGLGLAIVRQIVRSHGGRVTVGEGELGGALLTIVLPVAT